MAGGGGNQQTATSVNPMAGQDVYAQSANVFGQAAAGPNIGQFMNPFTDQVINRTGMDMMRQAAIGQNNLGAQAGAAGAFGGSRHGVAEGTMLGDSMRAFGDTAAGLRQSGFNTALSAAQNQQGIQSGLAGQGFGFGQAIGQSQMQQGTQQQAMMQALIDAARGQFEGFSGAPGQSLTLPLTALGASNMGQQTQTTSQSPGLLNFFSAGLGLL